MSDLGRRGVCTIYVAKTKALMSCVVTAQLICAFVFAYAKNRFSHDAAHIIKVLNLRTTTNFTVKTLKLKL